MKTLFVRVETEMGPRTIVASLGADDYASPVFQALASAGACVAVVPSRGGVRPLGELLRDRDRALVREQRATKLARDIRERETKVVSLF